MQKTSLIREVKYLQNSLYRSQKVIFAHVVGLVCNKLTSFPVKEKKKSQSGKKRPE